MLGKGSILLVLGFSLIFLVLATNYNTVASSAHENNLNYLNQSVAHSLAISGANIAANAIFLDQNWNTGINDLGFMNGEINVSVTTINGQKQITSEGEFNGVTNTVKITFNPSTFAKFAWYAGNMSSKVFITGDTVYGPFHSQSQMNIQGSPVYFGKVTNHKGFSPDPKQWNNLGYSPKFYAGFQTGVDIPLPTNYQFTEQRNSAIDGVANKGGSSYFENTDLYLSFKPNGTVRFRTGTGPDTNSYGPPQTLPVSEFAPNNMIYLKRGNIYVSGVISGELSIVSGESSGLGNGNIYLVGDLTYKNVPVTYAGNNTYEPTNSPDMLGLMATNNVIISSSINNRTNVRLDASVFCAQGGFKAEDISSFYNGKLIIRGGVIAAKEEIVGNLLNSGQVQGYKKYVIFDERNRLGTGPPLFPKTGMFEIVSWYE